MNKLGLPLRHEHSFRVTDDGDPLWRFSHDPSTQTIVVGYDLALYSKRRDIDALVSVIAGELHGLAARIHPNGDPS